MYKFISKIISNFKEIFKPFEAKTLLPYNVNNINGSQIFFPRIMNIDPSPLKHVSLIIT